MPVDYAPIRVQRKLSFKEWLSTPRGLRMKAQYPFDFAKVRVAYKKNPKSY